MNNPNLIEIKFTGNGIAPELIKASELAEILIAIERMLTPLIHLEDLADIKNPTLDEKNPVVVGLTNVIKGSLCLEFSSAIPDKLIPAFRKITTSINEGNCHDLPISSLKGLQSISKFTQKCKCSGQFSLMNGKREVLASITPEMKFELPEMLTGETILYGEVVRVGGKIPKVWLDVKNGNKTRIIDCDVDQNIAETLGKKLYTFVGLRGNAKWDAETLDLKHFRIMEINSDEIENELQWQQDLPLLQDSFFDELASQALNDSWAGKTKIMGFDEL